MNLQWLRWMIELPFIASVLLKMTLFLSLAWVLHIALRQANPRWRVLLWRGITVGVIAIPVLTASLPSWKVPVAPLRPRAVAQLSPPGDTVTPPPARGGPFPSSFPSSSLSPSFTPTRTYEPTASSQPAPPGVVTPTATSEKSSDSLLSWVKGHVTWVSVGVWAAGVLALSLRFLLGWSRIRRTVKSAMAVPGEVQNALTEIAREMDISREVRLRLCENISSPFLTGLRRPRLILPSHMASPGYSRELRAILAHELSHLRSGDLFWGYILRWLSVALWFHPFVWRMHGAHASACEQVSDALTADFLGDAKAYSRTLARVALEMAGPASCGVGGIPMARVADITRRLAMLRRRVFSAPLPGTRVAASVLVGLLAIALTSTLRLTHAERRTQQLETSDRAGLDTRDSTAKPAGADAASLADTASFERRLEFDKDILVELKAGKQVIGGYEYFTVRCQSVRFSRKDDQLAAALRVVITTVLNAKWRARLELLEADGRVLSHSDVVFESQLAIRRAVIVRSQVLHFTLGRWSEVSKATSFRILIERVLDDKKPSADAYREPATSNTEGVPPSGTSPTASSRSEGPPPTAEKLAGERGRIRGVVVNADTGEPTAGAYVAVDHSGDAGGTNLGRFREEGIYVTTETDQAGRFLLEGVAFHDNHPFMVTHPGFVRHQETIALKKDQPEIDIRVRLRPAGTLVAKVVDAEGNLLEENAILRLEAEDGRPFFPMKGDWPDLPYRTETTKTGTFSFGELDTGLFCLEVMRARHSEVIYHARVSGIAIEAGETKEVLLKPADYRSVVTVKIEKDPYASLGDAKGATAVLVTHKPGLLAWAVRNFYHPEDERLGRVWKSGLVMAVLVRVEEADILQKLKDADRLVSVSEEGRISNIVTSPEMTYTFRNFPPGDYAVFTYGMGMYKEWKSPAVYLRGAKATASPGTEATVTVPWTEPTGPSTANARKFYTVVNLEARDYTAKEICELLARETGAKAEEIVPEPAIESERVALPRANLPIWDLLETIYLNKGWQLEADFEAKTIILRASAPKPSTP